MMKRFGGSFRGARSVHCRYVANQMQHTEAVAFARGALFVLGCRSVCAVPAGADHRHRPLHPEHPRHEHHYPGEHHEREQRAAGEQRDGEFQIVTHARATLNHLTLSNAAG
jgi:hypothetical protein